MNIPKINGFEILDRITDAVIALDHEWSLTYINQQASKLLCRSSEELIGKNLWEEFPEAVNLPFYKYYHQAVREQVSVNFDAYFPPLKTWFDVRAYPSPNGLSVYFQDITEKKELANKREQHYKSLFENNPDAVFSFDLAGNYISVNPSMEHLLGYSEEEFLSMSYIPLVPKDEIEKTRKFFSKATMGETQHYETKAIHKNGNVIDVKVTNMPIIVNNQIVGVYGIAKDITRENQTKNLLLESEKLTVVGQLAASIAHEIRNPLTSIKGFLQLIRSTEEINSQYLSIMADEITRIESITSELLILAKPQAEHYQNQSLNKIIEDVVILLGSQALINNIEFKLNLATLPNIQCNASQLKQVFINILKNSIEAMPDGGEISVSGMQQSTNEIFIQVIDQGCGIPQDLLQKIGSPFYTTKEKGTGLGMMTTLKIVDAHGGTMDISSVMNEGTIISIKFPINIDSTKIL
ncbi:PAS domain-containing sensor histidine kinase [Peribacillus alkalitolerans]|uniref:PAS domain-containing sensor histidine kinase n=1 Tax=Peribacillus alkalitolerans TaxID=1550385 RepID=UPI0013D0F118|nr:PAS domain-containing sensor histidine kinase [Peribacillus alkalitolerans]